MPQDKSQNEPHNEPQNASQPEAKQQQTGSPAASVLQYLTADIPGIGGTLKKRREDFLVEELALYEPAGQGEHLMLCIEKSGSTTTDIQRQIAKSFRVPRSSVSFAGLKDKHAVTRQHFSVHLPKPNTEEDGLGRMQYTRAKLLWAERHGNKLRRGHLKGNRFVIYLRDVEPTDVIKAKQILTRLEETGVPNYVGEQRFGYRGTNGELGRLLLLNQWEPFCNMLLGQPRETDFEQTRAAREAYDRGDYLAALDHWPKQLRQDRQALDTLRQGRSHEQAVFAIDRQQRSFLISALQSMMFNHVVQQRMIDGTLNQLIEGDLAWQHVNRSVFAVDAATAALENGDGGRVPTGSISPSGPMWGKDMIQPAGQVLQQELDALHAFDLTIDALAEDNVATPPGARRPLRVFLSNAGVSGGVDEHGSFVRFSFDLPRGCFATVVLREIMKNDHLELGAGDADGIDSDD